MAGHGSLDAVTASHGVGSAAATKMAIAPMAVLIALLTTATTPPP